MLQRLRYKMIDMVKKNWDMITNNTLICGEPLIPSLFSLPRWYACNNVYGERSLSMFFVAFILMIVRLSALVSHLYDDVCPARSLRVSLIYRKEQRAFEGLFYRRCRLADKRVTKFPWLSPSSCVAHSPTSAPTTLEKRTIFGFKPGAQRGSQRQSGAQRQGNGTTTGCSCACIYFSFLYKFNWVDTR